MDPIITRQDFQLVKEQMPSGDLNNGQPFVFSIFDSSKTALMVSVMCSFPTNSTTNIHVSMGKQGPTPVAEPLHPHHIESLPTQNITISYTASQDPTSYCLWLIELTLQGDNLDAIKLVDVTIGNDLGGPKRGGISMPKDGLSN